MKTISAVLCCILFTVAAVFAGVPGDGARMAETCTGCHGTQGASPGTSIPVIGGQNADYLKKVMKEYRDDIRPGGVMANLAKGYSDSQINELSMTVSSWKWKSSPAAAKGSKINAAAESCAACHGKKGEGSAFAPHIGGQAPGYLKEALQEYKNGKRKASEMAMMKDVADAELDKLVKYYSRK